MSTECIGTILHICVLALPYAAMAPFQGAHSGVFTGVNYSHHGMIVLMEVAMPFSSIHPRTGACFAITLCLFVGSKGLG